MFASMGNVRQTSIGGTPSWKVGTELPSCLAALWVTLLLLMLPDPGVVVPSCKGGTLVPVSVAFRLESREHCH